MTGLQQDLGPEFGEHGQANPQTPLFALVRGHGADTDIIKNEIQDTDADTYIIKNDIVDTQIKISNK